ncbi:MAG: hypothetical protein JWM59_954 [Verrucomicrobiales bacterium]|nr:hypothetical protein [Verrucomicrobiales bacterium]
MINLSVMIRCTDKKARSLLPHVLEECREKLRANGSFICILINEAGTQDRLEYGHLV